jgi:hypothetical protein
MMNAQWEYDDVVEKSLCRQLQVRGKPLGSGLNVRIVKERENGRLSPFAISALIPPGREGARFLVWRF